MTNFTTSFLYDYDLESLHEDHESKFVEIIYLPRPFVIVRGLRVANVNILVLC
jgi:hypothetical protein